MVDTDRPEPRITSIFFEAAFLKISFIAVAIVVNNPLPAGIFPRTRTKANVYR